LATKYLDLDAVDVPIGRIKINGTEYTIEQPSVKALINIISLENKDDVTTEDLDDMLQIIHQMSGIEVETLQTMSMSKLQALMAFLNTIGDEAAEKNSDAPLAGAVETVALPTETEPTEALTETPTAPNTELISP
jgi:hypothetical protein